jgi:hypothetical protein
MRICLIALAAACLVLAGCGKKHEEASRHITISGKDGKVTISGNGEHFTMKANDGKTTFEINAGGLGANVKLPAFLPLYPGAKVQSSLAGIDAKGGGGMIAFETGARPAEVIGFYKQKSAAAGFTESFNMQSGEMMTFASSAKEGKKGMQVVATKTEHGTSVQVTWSGGN